MGDFKVYGEVRRRQSLWHCTVARALLAGWKQGSAKGPGPRQWPSSARARGSFPSDRDCFR